MLTECLLRSAPTAQQGVSWQRRLCGLKRCKRVNIYRLFCAFDGGGGGDTLFSFLSSFFSHRFSHISIISHICFCFLIDCRSRNQSFFVLFKIIKKDKEVQNLS